MEVLVVVAIVMLLLLLVLGAVASCRGAAERQSGGILFEQANATTVDVQDFAPLCLHLR